MKACASALTRCAERLVAVFIDGRCLFTAEAAGESFWQLENIFPGPPDLNIVDRPSGFRKPAPA